MDPTVRKGEGEIWAGLKIRMDSVHVWLQLLHLCVLIVSFCIEDMQTVYEFSGRDVSST